MKHLKFIYTNEILLQEIFNIHINILIQMISRIITRGIMPLARLYAPAASLLTVPKFQFARKNKTTAAPSVHSMIDEEIKAEVENPNDIESYEKEFKEGGWTIVRQSTQVEISKTVGDYQVRLVSNIKTPTSSDEEGDAKAEEEEEDYKGEMNDVTIFVTKNGSEKTMAVHTVVTEGYEITNINFAANYAAAKKERFEIFRGNRYVGPEMETLSDELFESLYQFLEEQIGITNENMETFADYCLDCEQNFYIDWLKDLKAFI